MSISMDLPSLSMEVLGSNDPAFVWPVPYDRYLGANNRLHELIIKQIYDPGLPQMVSLAAIAAHGAVLVDAERAVKTALELHGARAAGQFACFDPRHSPVCAFLAGGATAAPGRTRIADFFPGRVETAGPAESLRGIAARAVTAWNMRFRPRSARMDMHNSSPLLDEFLEQAERRPVLLRAERWPRGEQGSPPQEICVLAGKVCSAVESVLGESDCDPALARRAAALSEIFIRERLTTAYVQTVVVERLALLDHAGGTLVGGTPKVIGRLINRRYQKMGRKTWRFAHGGDRVFFDDPMWPMTELPFVGRYHVHGSGEARHLTARYRAGSSHVLAGGTPEFFSYGSLRHQRWFERGRSEPATRIKRSPRRVMLVPGSFLGEFHMGPLNFKLPDPLAADTQSHIIKTLVRAGFEVSVKPHPKGLFTDEKPHAGMGAELVGGAFDPVAMDVDCFLFEFAGSAFFDALAGNKGVVLVDTLHRPWDDNARHDLENRCEIVSAERDEFNRIRVPEDTLIDAVNNACERSACPDEFAKKFFYGDG